MQPVSEATDAAPKAAPATSVRDDGPIVLFDGHCNFCNGTVNFLIDRDRRGTLRFAALESAAGRRLLAERGVVMPEVPDTMVFIDGPRVLLRSDAALATTAYLRQPWPLVRAARIVPRFLRDAVYALVARNRYRWFGRTEACRVPTPAVRARFLED